MNNITELVFIIDKSGSMSGLESDTIGGFNSTLKKEIKNEATKAYVTTVLFSDKYETLHDRVEISKIEPLTEKEYEVGGSTALLDAVGSTIEHISKIHRYIRKEDVPDKTLFVIITDGMENSSHIFNRIQIKSMISAMREKHNWEFIFLGANIEAEEVAESYGILKNCSVEYNSDKIGTKAAWESIDNAVMHYRMCSYDTLDNSDWKDAVILDKNQRLKKMQKEKGS